MTAMHKRAVVLTMALGLAACGGAGSPSADGLHAAKRALPAPTAAPRNAGAILAPAPFATATLERLLAMRGSLEASQDRLRNEVRALEQELAAASTDLERKVGILTRLRTLDRRLAETETRLAAIDRATSFARERAGGLAAGNRDAASARF